MSASEFFDAEELPSNAVQPPGEVVQELEEDHRHGDGSDTSSEAGSLTSEDGSVSSESELGHEYHPTNSMFMFCKYVFNKLAF